MKTQLNITDSVALVRFEFRIFLFTKLVKSSSRWYKKEKKRKEDWPKTRTDKTRPGSEDFSFVSFELGFKLLNWIIQGPEHIYHVCLSVLLSAYLHTSGQRREKVDIEQNSQDRSHVFCTTRHSRYTDQLDDYFDFSL